MFGNIVITCANPEISFRQREFPMSVEFPCVERRRSLTSFNPTKNPEQDKRRASALVDELLLDIYSSMHNGTTEDYYSTSQSQTTWVGVASFQDKNIEDIKDISAYLQDYIQRTGSLLVRQLKRRDALRRQQQAHCDVITRLLVCRYGRDTHSVDMRFTIQPSPGDSGFSQWVAAMKMVAQLPGGIPPEFRRRLWITMAERHLSSRGVDWTQVEKSCFSEWSHPADAELGIQIVKDLHRTGCSLFCGENGQENQALLKKVLLAYARWNKDVGYCQGFNMLAALMLQVTDRCEQDALKLMIYLIEGVLPDSYFADSLRGLSVDMAVFRELLRSKLPRLSKHLDLLQNAAKDGSRSYEPPLTNVFTMQWFLTLFCNCLPQPTVLRVWDLIFLEGNEILLRTALSIWQVLAQRILVVRTADEFYCIMGALTRELLESNLIDANTLIKAIVAIGPLTELKSLRDHYLYNITPWGTSIPQQPKHHVIPLDISALKKQYVKLKQRQRQAHVIFSSAITRQPTPPVAVAMNHLLVGKRALAPAKRTGPAPGSIPPARQPSTLQWKDAQKGSSSSSSSDTELCDDEVQSSDEDVAAAPPAKDTDSEGEFENFLADRIGIKEDEETNSTRRNSEMALQIIQENSLILHRIMQCQSRLSPSPPVDDVNKMQSVSSWIDSTQDKGYTSLLEKSHSLDERCNSLLLAPALPESKSENVISSLHPFQLSEEDSEETIAGQMKPVEEEDIATCQSETFSLYPFELCKEDSEGTIAGEMEPVVEEDIASCQSETSLLHTFELSKKDSEEAIAEEMEPVVEEDIATCQSKTSPLHTFELSKEDSGETIAAEIVPVVEEDIATCQSETKESSKLIQENLNILKAFSTKAKVQEERKRLIQENVSLLESISNQASFDTKLPDLDEEFSLLAKASVDSGKGSSVETDCDTTKLDKTVFNPFPVALNSRQNKEVPLKLGLYKK